MVAKTVKRSPGDFLRHGGEHLAPRIPSVDRHATARDRCATGKGRPRWYDRACSKACRVSRSGTVSTRWI
jgi:hypothetical protein